MQTPTRTSSRAALVLALALAAGAGACGGRDDDADPAGTAGTDAAGGAASGATASGTTASGGAADGTAAASTATSADSAALRSYTLSMEKVNGFFEANLNMARVVKANPELRERTHASGAESLDAVARRFEQEPAVRKAIEDAGLSPREFTLTMFSLFQAAYANRAMQEQKIGADSAARAAGINPANLDFVRRHQQELAQRQQNMEREMQVLGAQ